VVKQVRFCGDLRDVDRSCGGITAILSDYNEVPNLKRLKDKRKDRKRSTTTSKNGSASNGSVTSSKEPPKPSTISFGDDVPEVDI
jgi:hypothetical protein